MIKKYYGSGFKMGKDSVHSVTGKRRISVYRRDGSNSISDNNDVPFEKASKRRKFCQSVSGSFSRDTDRTRHTPAAGLK
jgi:hypothetical protein